MNDDPYRPDDRPPEQVTAGSQADKAGRPGCLSPGSISVFFLGLTVLFLIYFALLIVNPYVPINPFPPRTPLPIYIVASADPNVPMVTPTPTKLSETPRFSTLEPTAAPTLPPSPTDAGPASATPIVGDQPRVPTATPITPTPTLVSGPGLGDIITGVFTPPPAGDAASFTRSPFPFTVFGDEVQYIANPNDQACRWASIAGSVTDIDGQPLPGLALHVMGEGIDEIRFTGTALTYGDGGYEVFLNGAPLRSQYVVQLLSQTGTPISAEFTVTTSASCEENVAIVNFVQNFEY